MTTAVVKYKRIWSGGLGGPMTSDTVTRQGLRALPKGGLSKWFKRL
ncbi:hypothetical protein CLOSTASPAR_02945 [[Clostridium] asparagiforme DSM 15981]|uniref:Uncharacterized protein n=1 Tax=[Clostridium] asparagiforme DSM 15981 TaxID=518636 RepID=C0D108_9FIRM|nr:hypothetical protein CLOSTASPAR_02945 [[Clostridium] asparagiforme DSM 15981]